MNSGGWRHLDNKHSENLVVSGIPAMRCHTQQACSGTVLISPDLRVMLTWGPVKPMLARLAGFTQLKTISRPCLKHLRLCIEFSHHLIEGIVTCIMS